MRIHSFIDTSARHRLGGLALRPNAPKEHSVAPSATSRFRILQIAAVTLLLGSAVGTLHSQVTAGAISGTVTDSTSAVISGATVTVINQGTGLSSSLTTDVRGFYSAEALNAGTYLVDASKAGFERSITRGVHLDPGQRRATNVSLRPGTVTSQVTVDANPLQVDTETSESGGTITSKQISELMLNGRDFQSLGIVVPGVASIVGNDNISSTGFGSSTGWQNPMVLMINGLSAEYSTYTLDGIYNMDSGALQEVNVVPMAEGISEFSVLKNNYSAKYGFTGGGQITVNTKSGTDTFHGSAWDYLRNDALDASNYFSTSKQRLHQNIFGFTFGGPVIIPKLYNTNRSKKTFFFAAIQRHAINAGQVNRGAYFTRAMRNGDFSASPTLPTQGLTLDAHSAALLAAEGKTNCIAGATTLNTACFDPAAVAIMDAAMPLPNNQAAGFLNYINQGEIITRQTDYQFRIDHSINSTNLLTARLMAEPQDVKYPYSAWTFQPSNLMQDAVPYKGWNNMIRLTSTITPKLVNAATVAQTSDRLKFALTRGGILPAGTEITQAFPGADPNNRIPSVNISTGWSGVGPGAEPISATDGEGIVTDDVTWVKGKHVLQAGALYMWGIKRQTVFTIPQGSFTFSGVHTGDPAADYLLGLNTTYSQAQTQKHANAHYRQVEAYVQDDWKISPRLTLNLGLRWVYFSNDWVDGNQVTSFSPTAFNSAEAPVVNVDGSLLVNSQNQPITSTGGLANSLNGLLFAGRNGVPRGFFIPTKKNFGPRVGFAYDVFGNGRTAIRGGYGIGYVRIPLEAVYDAFGQNPPFNLSANILNSLLSNATAGTTASPTNQTLFNVPSSFVPTQIQSYSLTLEHQVTPNMVATVAYAGSVGRHLMTFQGGFDRNFPLPVSAPSAGNCLAPGQAPTTSYDFDPCINVGLSSPDFTRPYHGYSPIFDVYDKGSSNYNSLQSGLIYNAGNSRFNLSYTYSKTLGTIGTHTSLNPYSQITASQNPRNFAAEYGPPSYDFTHAIVGSWIYTIPYHSAKQPAALLLGNWSIAGLALHQSGYALSPSMATATAGLAIRPNQVAPYRRVGKLNEWFDTSAFAPPNYGFFGDARNGTIRGPAFTSFNMALYKGFPVTERFRIEFRAEAFNLANHPNFNNVSTAVGSANFGQVTGAGDPRNVEFGLKLIY